MWTHVRRTLVPGVLLVTAACSETSGPDLETLEPVDALVAAEIVSVVADGVAQDLDLMGAGQLPRPSGALFLGGPVLSRTPDCPFDGTSFTCTRERLDDLEMTRVITFLDEAGEPMAGYDELLTASMEIVAEVTGSVTGERVNAQVDRTREKVATGLLGEEETRTWNGSGTSDVTREITRSDGSVWIFDTDGESLTTDVVIPVADRASRERRWPLSGTVTQSVTVRVERPDGTTETRTRQATVTFNGTSVVPVEINGETYEVDLDQRRERKFRRDDGGGSQTGGGSR